MPYTIEGTGIDGIPEPILGEGTTFVPLANVSQALGGYANYDHESKIANIELGDYKVAVQADNPEVNISGQLVSLQAAPFIDQDTMWVPVRLFQTLGYTMNVDGDEVTLASA
ncbi:MAG: copper amine oxidase N-terminal domain-containing protein [Armatimonas sp.]